MTSSNPSTKTKLSKKTPAKKTPAKKTPAKKTPAKKTPAKKTPAKKTPAKKTPAKKTTAKKTTAKKKTPAKKTTAKKTSAKNASKKSPATALVMGADVRAYLAAFSQPAVDAMLALRERLLALIPAPTERISYGIPIIYEGGAGIAKGVIAWGGTKTGYSIYLMSGRLLEDLGDEVAPYASGKSTLRFTPTQRPSDRLLKRIVTARRAENAALAKSRQKR